AGADDYIEKPFRPKELLARIARHLQTRGDLRARYRRQIALTPEAPPLKTADEELLERVRAAIEQHLHLPDFNAEALAEASSISKSQLNRRLRALGLPSAAVLLRDARLDHAAQLLA